MTEAVPITNGMDESGTASDRIREFIEFKRLSGETVNAMVISWLDALEIVQQHAYGIPGNEGKEDYGIASNAKLMVEKGRLAMKNGNTFMNVVIYRGVELRVRIPTREMRKA